MSLEHRKTFYQTAMIDGNRELDYLQNRLMGMELKTMDKFRITAGTVNRPDLISNIFFGTYNLGWLLHHHNNILDPLTEYYIGRVIEIPSLDDYYRYYNRNARKV